MTAGSHRVDAFFEEGGPLSSAIPGFLPRPQQLSMAQAVEEAILGGTHLAVEAGTGVGKSLAYLIPAIQSAVGAGKRVVVSTYTLSLQDQLIVKDLPSLDGAFDHPFVARAAKGRGNYLSPRRLDLAMASLFKTSETDELAASLRHIDEWAHDTVEGVRQELQPVPSADAWELVQSEHGNCLGKRCEYFEGGCFYHDARRRLEDADLLVVNHSLLVADLILRQKGFALLPAYDVAILDEAHKFVGVAVEHFGERVSRRMTSLLLNRLSSTSKKGVLDHMSGSERARQLTASARNEATRFFDDVRRFCGGDHGQRVMGDGAGVENRLSNALRDLGDIVEHLKEGDRTLEQGMELSSLGKRAKGMADSITWILRASESDSVFWCETGRNKFQVELNARPLDVAGHLKETILEETGTVVAASATLSVGGSDGLSPFMREIGMESANSLALGSPFDYKKNVKLRVPTYLEEPNHSDTYVETVAHATLDYIKQSDGGAFVLFTSYAFMNKVYAIIAEHLERLRFSCFVQGGDLPRGVMLEEFKADRRSVLFGTASFWEGVDVPGNALRLVIIVRLPFPVPTAPLFAARAKRAKEKGENDFVTLSLPEAIIRFKQGFGRLIRTETDRGTVVVMDTRIITKRYGKQFLQAIPDLRLIQD